MAYSNNNKITHSTPIWLPSQLRTATSALASVTGTRGAAGRYIYYTAGTLFYKYDT